MATAISISSRRRSRVRQCCSATTPRTATIGCVYRQGGTASNRSGIGAVVRRVTSTSGAQWQMVHSGSSYASQSELTLTFGLGVDAKATRVDVTWPSGRTQTLTDVANQLLQVTEP